jgi:hypothetical protein
LFALGRLFVIIIETIVDGILPHGFVWVSKKMASGVMRMQSGIVFSYVAFFFVFILLIFQYYQFSEGSGSLYFIWQWLKTLI